MQQGTAACCETTDGEWKWAVYYLCPRKDTKRSIISCDLTANARSAASQTASSPPPNIQSSPASSHRMLWDLRLISFQQRFMSPAWCELPPLSLLHSVPSSCPSPSTVDWHGTQWHPGHEGRPAAATHRREEALKRAQVIGAFLNIR